MTKDVIISLCAAVVLAVAIVSISLIIFDIRRNFKRSIRILGVGVFVMLFFILLPSHVVESGVFAPGLAILEAMSAMFLNASPGDILVEISKFDVPFIEIYKTAALVLLTVAPLFTIGITLSFFSDKFTEMVYSIRALFSDSYLFSDINERTLSIAEDVVRDEPRATLIFSSNKPKQDVEAEYMARIKEMGAFVVNCDIVNIRHTLGRRRNYYLLAFDGAENLAEGLKLYEKYNARANNKISMWLYTNEEISEVIFDNLYENFNVRLINEGDLIARSLVVEYPLYDAVREGKLTVLIVGCGDIGLEIVRTVAMCSCLGDGVESEIHVVDRAAGKAKRKLEKTSPRLAEKFGIHFHNADVTDSTFTRVLSEINPTYVTVTLGNENLNMEAALYIRRIYGITDGLPYIHIRQERGAMNEQIMPNLRVCDWKYNGETLRYEATPICDFDIRVFGSNNDIYSKLRIDASYQACLAIAVNAVRLRITAPDETYTREKLLDLYNQVNYYKEYANSYALSIGYKLYMMGLELCEDGRGDVSLLRERLKTSISEIRKHENRRFEAFMRSIGWTELQPHEIKDPTLRDKLAQKHARLDNANIDELRAMTGRDFEKEDEGALLNMPYIIELANQLFGKSYSVVERQKK